MNCWAACLGGCSDKASREHLVSESLFPEGEILVQGFPWCKDEPKRIGIAGLTAKILCTRHNNDLSPVDEAGANAFNTLREVGRLGEFRLKYKPRQWRIAKFRIDGPLLERWLLKTLINICCDQQYPIGRESNVAGRPTDELVRVAFGLDPFRGRAGLSVVVRIGMNLRFENSVMAVTLLKDDHVEAAAFLFYGFTMLLFLHPEGAPPRLDGIRVAGEDLGNCLQQFHCKKFQGKMGHYLSHVVRIDWP
jgi:hypothetical protein